MLASNIPLCILPGLNVKIPDRSLSSHTLEKGSGTFNEQTLIYMFENQETNSIEMNKNFYKNK